MNELIHAESLVKQYGQRKVIDGIDVKIERGEVIAVIGPNGAGKTTMLEILLGIRLPSSGKVSYWRPDPRGRIGAQLQSTPFFPGMTAKENLQLFGAFYGVKLSAKEIDDTLLRCGLSEVAKTDASRLSGGQQKRLAIAMTLSHNPELIFLDEPTAALDPRARHEIRELIHTLAKSGITIVFSSHDMEEVEKIASRIIFVYKGQVKASGSVQQLLEESNASGLEELYLKYTE